MSVTHMLIETGRASRTSACDEPFANGQPGSEDLDDVTCTACRAVMTADRNVVAEDGYQERDDCAEAVLLPAESIALTVALAQMERGETPEPNVSGMCILGLARLAGRHDWTQP